MYVCSVVCVCVCACVCVCVCECVILPQYPCTAFSLSSRGGLGDSDRGKMGNRGKGMGGGGGGEDAIFLPGCYVCVWNTLVSMKFVLMPVSAYIVKYNQIKSQKCTTTCMSVIVHAVCQPPAKRAGSWAQHITKTFRGKWVWVRIGALIGPMPIGISNAWPKILWCGQQSR